LTDARNCLLEVFSLYMAEHVAEQVEN